MNSISKKFSIRPTKGRDDLGSHRDNLCLNDFSFFNLNNELIIVKTLIPNKNYRVKNVYNTSTIKFKNRITIHITDSTSNRARNGNKNYVLSGIFEFNDIVDAKDSEPINFKSTVGLDIDIFNDDFNVNAHNIITYMSTKNPKESGGGIIIEGP